MGIDPRDNIREELLKNLDGFFGSTIPTCHNSLLECKAIIGRVYEANILILQYLGSYLEKYLE